MLTEKIERAAAGHRFDATHSCRDTGFAHHLEKRDLGRVPDVRTAAQLHAQAGDSHDPHDVAVLLAEQRHRPARDRLGVRLLLECELYALENPAIDEVFDFRELLGAERTVVRKIESQSIGRDKRPGLMHVLAEDLSERGVEKVRGGVIPLGVAAAVARHNRSRLPELHVAGDFAERGDASVNFAYFFDVDAPPFALNLAAVGDLPTGLDVKRRFTEDYGRASVGEITLGDYFGGDVEGIVPREGRRLYGLDADRRSAALDYQLPGSWVHADIPAVAAKGVLIQSHFFGFALFLRLCSLPL